MTAHVMATRPRLLATTPTVCPWNEEPLRVIALNIRGWAAREQIRQSDLSEMLGVGLYRIGKVWRGHPRMSMTLALDIAQAMGMEYFDVFEGVVEKEHQMPGLSLNRPAFRAWRRDRTIEVAAADLGMSVLSLSRVLYGKSQPGPQFIAACLMTIPARFDQLFDVHE